jgi:16S rRNA (uracil1498-N3)-methyltransferase
VERHLRHGDEKPLTFRNEARSIKELLPFVMVRNNRMPDYDFSAPRLFVDAPLREGDVVALERDQSNYLGNVLRLAAGDGVLVFNGRDGEWRAAIGGRKRPDVLTVQSRTRPQDRLPDVAYVFAPLKHARLDYMVQKAVEMGASCLQPVMTRFTQASRVNGERMRANVIEAAEQCGILSLAEVKEPMPLQRFLTQRPPERLLVFCDEGADVANPRQALEAAPALQGVDVLIGPEGGFAEEERTLLLRQPRVTRLALGPRILRADTAAVAALALVQAVLGDWRGG